MRRRTPTLSQSAAPPQSQPPVFPGPPLRSTNSRRVCTSVRSPPTKPSADQWRAWRHCKHHALSRQATQPRLRRRPSLGAALPRAPDLLCRFHSVAAGTGIFSVAPRTANSLGRQPRYPSTSGRTRLFKSLRREKLKAESIKSGIVHLPLRKADFPDGRPYLRSVQANKPSGAKGASILEEMPIFALQWDLPFGWTRKKYSITSPLQQSNEPRRNSSSISYSCVACSDIINVTANGWINLWNHQAATKRLGLAYATTSSPTFLQYIRSRVLIREL